MLTAYDATFAAVADAAGVETILVGDSLGMVCQGLPSTVGVSLETMAYHTASVARGLRRAQGTAWVVADLPYGSYQESAEQAMRSATVLMQAGAHMVKLEGGGWTAPIGAFFGGARHPRVRPPGPDARKPCMPWAATACRAGAMKARPNCAAHALQLQDMGASMLVLEMVPAELSARLTEELTHCHTIGIGAGNGTAGPGAGAARHAGHEPGQDAQICAQLHAGDRQHQRGHGRLRACGKGRQLSRQHAARLVNHVLITA